MYLETGGAPRGRGYKKSWIKVLSILILDSASYSPLGASIALFPPFSNLTAVGSKDTLNPLIKQKMYSKTQSDEMY